MITNEPVITGKTIYSSDTSPKRAIKGLAAAGGCITFRYIIKVTVVPTAKASDKNVMPINLLNKMPTTMPKR